MDISKKKTMRKKNLRRDIRIEEKKNEMKMCSLILHSH